MHASAWLRVALAVTIVSYAGAGRSIGAEPAPSGGQAKLDLIAGFSFDNTFKELGAPPPPTGPFSSWTADQQRSAPADLQRLCASFWTFTNGADGLPSSRLLAASLSGTDEIHLVMDVCLIAHMPDDWPERSARLQAATAILKQSNRSWDVASFAAAAKTEAIKAAREVVSHYSERVLRTARHLTSTDMTGWA